MSYGNHDYQPVTEQLDSLPNNVHVFSNQVETKTLTLADDQTVAITGFSYGKRWLVEDQVREFPEKGTVDWQIGMLHGAISQNNPDQDHYAPFTLPELLRKKYDYWALGHIHKHQVLNDKPLVVYPGNPQGRHKNEDGHHGYYLVQSDSDKLTAEFKPVAPIEWCEIDVQLKNNQTIDSLIEMLLRKGEAEDGFKMIAFNVHLTDQDNVLTKKLLANGTILERLQENLSEKGNYQWWPYQLNLLKDATLPKMTDLDQEYWDQSAQDVFNQDAVIDLADKLVKYGFIADQLADPSLVEQLRYEASQKLGEGDHDEN